MALTGALDVIGTIGGVLRGLLSRRRLFGLLGLLAGAKTFPPARRDHTYGIVIAARNEERVIGQLLESIALQDYDRSLLRVYVVADNCTDGTADIARRHGATVYERRDPERARKGWALEFLFEQIDRDYGIDSVDAYLFFDADNLLSRSFITEMNRAFDHCGDIAVGYRNTKNFDTSFISAAYALHFYHSTVFLHRPRARLGLSTHIAGTGYAVASRILAGGWHWTCLTEDTQFCLTQIARGRKIAFCEAAEFFDEQPYTIPVMFRQRLRWVKGRLACFFLLLPKLLAGLVRGRWRGRLSCLDMLSYITPWSVLSVLRGAAALVRFAVEGFLSVGLPALVLTSVPGALPGVLAALGVSWLRLTIRGALIVLRERRHIRCGAGKLVLYTLLWPLFDLSGPWIALASLVTRVTWKPIRHDRDIAIRELEAAGPAEKTVSGD